MTFNVFCLIIMKDVERKKGKSPDIFDPLMQGCHSECVNGEDIYIISVIIIIVNYN